MQGLEPEQCAFLCGVRRTASWRGTECSVCSPASLECTKCGVCSTASLGHPKRRASHLYTNWSPCRRPARSWAGRQPVGAGGAIQDYCRIGARGVRGGVSRLGYESEPPVRVKENLDTSTEAQRQFLREAMVLANLSHPNLPRVTDHFVIPNQGQYLVMDFVEGQDLASLQQRQPALSLEHVIDWISQVAEALIYLHGRQPPVLHRDIKPANIRLTPDGKAMLVDFGLVKMYDPNLKTTMGARALTPGYAPPEQYGRGRTDARSDIYALGATLYKLLSGQERLRVCSAPRARPRWRFINSTPGFHRRSTASLKKR